MQRPGSTPCFGSTATAVHSAQSWQVSRHMSTKAWEPGIRAVAHPVDLANQQSHEDKDAALNAGCAMRQGIEAQKQHMVWKNHVQKKRLLYGWFQAVASQSQRERTWSSAPMRSRARAASTAWETGLAGVMTDG